MFSTTIAPAGLVRVGDPAPDLTMPIRLDRWVSLADSRDSIVVLAFYPGDFSPVCTDHLSTQASRHGDFEALGATLVGISVDGIFSHRAFAVARGIGFDFLADFEPKGAVARRHGAYREGLGFAHRALVVVDGVGIVPWVWVADPDDDHDPGADAVLAAVREVAADPA